MSDWFYKATNAKLDYVGTLRLLNRGFLCRSAYVKGGSWASNVQAVAFGDVVHIYFIARKPRALGAYEIIRREDFAIEKPTPKASDFTGPVSGCALYQVADPTFIHELDPDGGYNPDPTLSVFTGWLLRRVGPAADAAAKFLSEQSTLARR
jgi:hypothetical protein